VNPFRRTTGRVAVLDRADVDTDQIVSKESLKRIDRTGFGTELFRDWRLGEDGRPRPGFELNNPAFADARILLAGPNFGCGSSREHAPWAIKDYGFEVLIAPSFGDIFASNAVNNGLVPITLPPEQVKHLMGLVDRENGSEMTVDLEQQLIVGPDGEAIAFGFDASARNRLLNGLDDIGLTLEHEPEIAAFERSHEPPVDTLALR
jgi:3-isopropylmalate/(R)-2-methylmalate dehydratase small subunit